MKKFDSGAQKRQKKRLLQAEIWYDNTRRHRLAVHFCTARA